MSFHKLMKEASQYRWLVGHQFSFKSCWCPNCSAMRESVMKSDDLQRKHQPQTTNLEATAGGRSSPNRSHFKGIGRDTQNGSAHRSATSVSLTHETSAAKDRSLAMKRPHRCSSHARTDTKRKRPGSGHRAPRSPAPCQAVPLMRRCHWMVVDRPFPRQYRG